MGPAKPQMIYAHVVSAMRALPAETERELAGELDVLAQLVARRMRQLAPKFRTQLANSVHIESPGPLIRDIRPGAAYAEAVERGVPAGGKGLPRFFDPRSADMVAWLRTKAFRPGARLGSVGSRRRMSQELELRDRYEGLAWHIRHHGVRAQPFVATTRQQMEPVVRVRLMAAAERAVKAAAARVGGQGGAA